MSLFFFCPSLPHPIILFQRVLLPFIHHLVNLLSSAMNGDLTSLFWQYGDNFGRSELSLEWSCADVVGQIPVIVVLFKGKPVPISPQSHAWLRQTCMSSLRSLQSITRIFRFIFFFLLIIFYQGF